MEVLIIVVVVLALLGGALAARIVKQYEQGVLFRQDLWPSSRPDREHDGRLRRP
jgi:hypothetical protein